MELSLLPSLSFRPAAFLAGYPGPWAPHIPFGHDLIAAIRPSLIVELGTHYGDSYFSFCQTVAQKEVPCTCYAVDTWQGDPHAGFYDESVYAAVEHYNNSNYRSFSYLLRNEFDAALGQFSNDSISLLHIDGLHTYEAVQRDFESWYPKVQPGGIVLFHDIAVRSAGFGVWRFWEELKQSHRCFELRGGSGLGLLEKPGKAFEDGPFLGKLFSMTETDRECVRQYYYLCSERILLEFIRGFTDWSDAGQTSIQAFFSRSGEYSEVDSVSQIIPSSDWSTVLLNCRPEWGRAASESTYVIAPPLSISPVLT